LSIDLETNSAKLSPRQRIISTFHYICTCRCAWSSPPMSSLVRGLSVSYESRNSEPRGSPNDEPCLREAEMTNCVSRAERSSDVRVASVTTASSRSPVPSTDQRHVTYEQDQIKCRYAPGDWVLARRPEGSLFITARDVPETWRLFRGVTRAAYSVPRLRFSPGCRDRRCIGSDGGEDGASSVRSRAARMRDFEEPGSVIVVVGRRKRPRRM
jgi:hypothetical protein